MVNPATDHTAKLRFFDAVNPAETPNVYLQIEGIPKPFVLMQYSATFAKNEIPMATCVLGTGDPVSESDAAAVPEELAGNLDGAKLTKAKVYLRFGQGSEWNPPAAGGWQWGVEKTCIFEGYYAGLSFSRVGAQIQLSVSLVHRLIDLTFGSLLTAWQHPSNPSNLLQPAVANLLGGCAVEGAAAAGGGGKKGGWTSGAFLKDKVEDNPSAFGDAILDTLWCMTDLDVFKMDCADSPPPTRPNLVAREVIDRMESKTGALRAQLTDPAFLGSIGNYLGGLIDTNQGTTYWDLLINKICPDFVLAVIPLPSIETDGGANDGHYAYLTPDTPGLDTPYKTLYLGEYTGFSLQARLWKPLYAVGVYSDGQDMSGAELNANKQKPIRGAKCVGGMFPNPAVLNDQLGQFLLVGAPVWLRDLNLLTGSMSQSGDTGKAAHDAMAADEELEPGDFEPADLDPQRSDIMHDYAKLIYVQNAINGRGGSFDSKLRFDIAPGSILKLDKGQGANASGATYKELPGSVLVQVSRVTYNINAESPMAKTTFECIHLRTEAEMEADEIGRFSVSDHVFLKDTFKGAPLIKKWEF